MTNSVCKTISCTDLLLFFDGKNTLEAKARPDECYSDSTPSRQIVEKWFADLKQSCINTDDATKLFW